MARSFELTVYRERAATSTSECGTGSGSGSSSKRQFGSTLENPFEREGRHSCFFPIKIMTFCGPNFYLLDCIRNGDVLCIQYKLTEYRRTQTHFSMLRRG